MVTSPSRPPAHAWASLFETPAHHAWRPARVRGRLPDLAGTFVQNGPGGFDAPWGRVGHPFDAGGVLRAVRFADGRAQSSVTPVRTPDLDDPTARVDAYTRSGKRPWFGLGRPRARNVANTHVVPWDGELLALFEHGLPTRIDPATLASRGHTDLGGCVQRSFTAHPHAVASRDTLFGFDLRYGLGSTTLVVIAWRAGGRPRELVRVPLPGSPFMVHDFAASDRHLVFAFPPVELDGWGVLRKRGTIQQLESWDGTRGTGIVVVPIDAPGRYRRFTVDPFWFWHTSNAWDDGDAVVLDLVRYPDYRSADWLQALYDGPPGFTASGTHARLRIDPAREVVETVWEGGLAAEFPQVDPASRGARTDVVWSAAHSSDAAEAAGPQDVLLRVDLDAGTQTVVDPGTSCFPSEPLVVPDRDGGRWILSTVFDAAAATSAVQVWSPDGEPVATVDLGQAVPLAFHGSWMPDPV